jgi:hypothetical protein
MEAGPSYLNKVAYINTYATGFKRQNLDLRPDHDAKFKDQVINKKVNHFDYAVLHEVGHGVQGKFMANRVEGGKAAWKVETIDSVAQVVGNELKFFDDFKESYDSAELQQYLTAVLGGEDKPAAPAVKAGQTDRVADLAAHEAVLRCKLIRMNGSTGLWDLRGGGAQKAAIDGRVYQQSYPDKWSSYDLAARQQGVCFYQFRAAGEWFAELYQTYFMQRLKPGHPDYGWLEQDFGPATKAPPA